MNEYQQALTRIIELEDKNAELLEDLGRYRNLYHMAEAKVLSRDALLEQLSENQLAQDVAKAEAINTELLEDLKLLRTVSRMPYPISKVWLEHYTNEAIRKQFVS